MALTAAQRLEELDRVLAAIAHASRRQILLTVKFRGGQMTAGDIAARFHCAWPTISRHLAVLEKAGLLTCEKEGRTRIYRLDAEKLAVVQEWLAWLDDEVSDPTSSSRGSRKGGSRKKGAGRIGRKQAARR